MRIKGALLFIVSVACATLIGSSASAGPERNASAASAVSYAGSGYGVGIDSTRRYWTSRIAVTGLGCNVKAGFRSLSDTYRVRIPRLIIAGPVTATAQTSARNRSAESVITTRISNVSLLSGLMTIGDVTAKSSTKRHDSHFALSTAGSGLDKLIVKGHSVRWGRKAVEVPGVGRILLDQRTKVISRGSAKISMIAFELVFAQNGLGVPVGTTLVLGDATSGLARGASMLGVSGDAYGTLRTGGSVLSKSSQPVQVGMCNGTAGMVRSDSVPRWKIPGVLTTGPIVVDVDGATGGQLTGKASSIVQSLNLYRGFITAKMIRADASINTSDGFVPSFKGSQFDELRIDGRRIRGKVRADTHLTFGNIAVYLKLTASSYTGGGITMLEVVATGPNKFRLTPGHTVRVGSTWIAG
jgi:hypothetical protein